MKYALIADIHSNLEAFQAVLAHARSQGAQRFLLLGDMVGYGPDPQAVLELCMELVEGGSAVAILGNHDAAACSRTASDMNDDARAAILWTRAQLKPRHTQWLMHVPMMHSEEGFTCVHASADTPEDWEYISTGAQALASVATAGASWVFSGHVHNPTLYYSGRDERMFAFCPTENVPIPVPAHRSWLVIPGSCGQPRDQRVGARYALFDLAQCRLTYFRLSYDYAAVAAKIRAAQLPEALARCVEGFV